MNLTSTILSLALVSCLVPGQHCAPVEAPKSIEDILTFKTTTVTTTSTMSPYVKNLLLRKRFCDNICKTNPSQGGTYCNCDSPPFYSATSANQIG